MSSKVAASIRALPARIRALPRPRFNRKVAVRTWWVLAILWVIYSGPIAYADDAINPTGTGSFFILPDLGGDGASLFWETYFSSGHYGIYSEAGIAEPVEKVLNVIANILMFGIQVITATLAILTSWLFSMTTIDGMGDAVANITGASATSALEWIFPSALALGGVIAYGSRGGSGEGALNNVLWLIVAGSLMIGLSAAPKDLINGVESVRTAGTEVVGTMGQGITVNGETPINHPNPDDDELDGSPSDITTRKSIDAVWRTIVVTPWCLAELGSLEACQQYGNEIVTKTGDDREDAIKEVASAQKGSGTETWIKGKDTGYAAQRVMITLVGLIAAAVFCIFLLVAALTALFSTIMFYLLLIIGPFFVALWCIQGAPRRWGNGWLRELSVQLLMSVIALLLFTALLALLGALFAATAATGWMMTVIFAIVAIIAAVQLRGRLEQIFGTAGSSGSGLGKYMVARQAMRMIGKMPLPGLPKLPRGGSGSSSTSSSTTSSGSGSRSTSTALVRTPQRARSRDVGPARSTGGPRGPVDLGYVNTTPKSRPQLEGRRQLPASGGRPQMGPGPSAPQPSPSRPGPAPRTGPGRQVAPAGPGRQHSPAQSGTRGSSRPHTPAHASAAVPSAAPRSTSGRRVTAMPAPAPIPPARGPVLQGEVVRRPRPVTQYSRPGIADAPQPRRTEPIPPRGREARPARPRRRPRH